VVPRTQNIKANGLKTGKRHLKFGKKTARWIDDPAEAREIDAAYGLKGSGDVWVEQDENLEWHEHHDGNTDGRKVSIHHYTFGQMGTQLPDRAALIGKKKVIGGKAYMYIEENGKMRLAPYRKGYRSERLRQKISKAIPAA
jgi:hypothetical protein